MSEPHAETKGANGFGRGSTIESSIHRNPLSQHLTSSSISKKQETSLKKRGKKERILKKESILVPTRLTLIRTTLGLDSPVIAQKSLPFTGTQQVSAQVLFLGGKTQYQSRQGRKRGPSPLLQGGLERSSCKKQNKRARCTHQANVMNDKMPLHTGLESPAQLEAHKAKIRRKKSPA